MKRVLRRSQSIRRRAQERGNTQSKYWSDVKSIAGDVKELVDGGMDETEAIDEAVYQNEWLIYYANLFDVLKFTSNEEALDEVGGVDAGGGFWNVMEQYATYAMIADVQEAYDDLPDSAEDDDGDY